MKKPLATSIEEETIQALKIFCATSGKKINEIIEEAIKKYLKENEK